MLNDFVFVTSESESEQNQKVPNTIMNKSQSQSVKSEVGEDDILHSEDSSVKKDQEFE